MFPQVFLFLLILIKCHGYQSSCCYEHNRHRIPQDVMVDVVNNLALKLLAIHNEGNDNNIAISPYGALSVLVALKEGVRGSAETEIYRASGIPSDLSVIRIGLRDIHRHLKSYFIPDEGFLSGMTFSHDNVTLNREYEDILRFYGFDINSFNNALYPDFTTTESISTSTEVLSTSTEALSTTTEATSMTTEAGSTTEEMSEKEGNGEMTSTTVATTTENVRVTRSEAPTTAEQVSTVGMTETQAALTTKTEAVTTEAASTVGMTSTEAVITHTAPTTAGMPETEVVTAEAAPTTAGMPETEVVTKEAAITTAGMTETEIVTTEATITTDGMTETEVVTTEVVPATIGMTETAPEVTTSTSAKETTSVTTSSPNESTTEATETSSVMFSELSTEMTTLAEITSTTNLIDGTTNSIDVTTDEPANNDTIRRNTRSVVDYIIARYYDDHVVTQRPPPYNSESDLYFLINGKYKETNINYMTYDTVLPFHYIPHLNTLALRFPLDSSKYYLLLLLPENPQQITKLICDLRLNSNLKYITDNLRYTHVKAIIPSFMLKGYVVLTPTFQKMGITRVFEPRQADFTPMTNDRGIYVTNIEQAITVNIKNYVDPSTMNNNRYLHQSKPVLFKADHPFLYFVIDSEIDVTLMAGKVVNPLNTRIK